MELSIKIMSLWNSLFKKKKQLGKDETVSVPSDSPITELSDDRITCSFISLQDFKISDVYDIISNKFGIPVSTIKNDIDRIVSEFNQNLVCCVEYPYVEPIYRDTYYQYYSKKHNAPCRFCFRISFFSDDVNEDNFYQLSTTELSDRYYGYITIRPTTARVIGYSFLSPKVLANHDFVCCLCRRTSSILGRKLTVHGFPFCGQDGEAMSCAETTLTVLMDYFSRKYFKYGQLLPSHILKILASQTYERQLPSKGILSENMAYVLRKVHFGIRNYTLNASHGDDAYDKEEFKTLLYEYIDSGFPLIVCQDNHTYLAIGRMKKNGSNEVNIVTMNDNSSPYKIVSFEQAKITSFIVPLDERIYLDGENCRPEAIWESLHQDLPEFTIIQDDKQFFMRKYLTSARSYKDFIASLNIPVFRNIISSTSMPRFIWVCEYITKSELSKQNQTLEVDSLLILNATEGGKSVNYLLLAKNKDKIIVKTSENNNSNHKVYQIYLDDNEKLLSFDGNLKGDHTKWLS